MNIPNTTGGLNRLLPTVLLALAVSLPAVAEDSWYQIELLLFLNPAPGEGAGVFEPIPQTGGSIPLQMPREADAPYALLPKAERELNAHRLQLNRSGRYESLLHLAWRQPVGNEGSADTLSFRIPAPRADGLDEPARLQGTLRLSRGRFLHADLDASYLPAQLISAPPPSSQISEITVAPPPYVYRLKEKRRMRSEELHYLDSPGLGALIIARPVKPEGEAMNDPSAGQTEPPPEAGTKAPIEPN